MAANLEHHYEIISEFYGESQVHPINRGGSLKVNLLPRSQFMEQLQREERLADRSKTSLSIVLFRFYNKEDNSEFNDIKMFLKVLKSSIRNTDILGYLGENVIGILLPITDEKGTQEFEKRIRNEWAKPSFSTIIRTYPDNIFDDILTENLNQPDFYPLLLADSTISNQFKHIIKRGIDIIGALFGILLLSPLMLITALAIKANSPGPIIFKQARIGKSGAPFTFYKFRSMFWNTDDQIHRQYIAKLINGNHAEINQGDNVKPLYKIKSDPRVTQVGRILRKTSIDEIPQLFNVLKGEMSLVGPRPPLPYEVKEYQSWHLRRVLEAKPGMTGLWQVDGRSATSFDDMVRFDIRYMLNWSLMLDLKILIKTVKVVLRSAGAV